MSQEAIKTQTNAEGPLSGLVVIDFGYHIAAPLAAMLLGDQGATVIKIRPPVKSPSTEAIDAFLDRGKLCVELDLKTPEGIAGARELLTRADVAVQNFRPGVATRLGIGPDTARALNPGIIYISMPAFESSDERAHMRGFEGIVAAAAGFFQYDTTPKTIMGLGPTYTALPLSSVYGACHAAIGTVMALIARARHGQGDEIEVPLLDAALSAMGWNLLRVRPAPWVYSHPPLPWFTRSVLIPLARGLGLFGGTSVRKWLIKSVKRECPPLGSPYMCRDGKKIYICITELLRAPVQLLEHLGLGRLLEDGRLTAENPYLNPRSRKNLLFSLILSSPLKRRLRQALTTAFRVKTAEEWERELCELGVPAAMIRTTEEWLSTTTQSDPSSTVTLHDPCHGPMTQPNRIAWLRGSEGILGVSPSWACRPVSLQEALKALPSRPQTVVGTAPPEEDPRPILKGIKVLDLSTFLAGPCCGRTLAEYGADVLKIDPPNSLYGPYVRWMGLDVNRGKRSVFLDLKDVAHKEAFWRLVEDADVVIHNFRPDALSRLGIEHQTAKRTNSRVIYVKVSAYGSPEGGQRWDWPGLDPTVQAATGIMSRYGWIHGVASPVDYLTGYSAAFGAALALYHRLQGRFPEGLVVETSLAQCALYSQLPYTLNFPGRQWNEPGGFNAIGENSLQRIYRCRDGWIFLGATPDDLPNLERFLGNKHAFRPADTALDGRMGKALECHLGRWKIRRAEIALRNIGVAAHRVADTISLRRHYLQESGKHEAHSHPNGPPMMLRQRIRQRVTVESIAPAYARFRNAVLQAGAPAPLPGADTEEALRAVGVPRERIQAIMAKVRAGRDWQARLLPF